MPTPETHLCPGGCGAQVPNHKLACPLCWARLPQQLKAEVLAAWGKRKTDPVGHLRVVAKARAWYLRNPRRSLLRNEKMLNRVAGQNPNRHEALYRSFTDPERRTEQ